ncbi:MAG: hypothetical protein KDD69_07870 [Bdellovibrionales bacterium]|nr:hypothetical protein [Bdellovibrionales bacterium]
MMHIRRGSSLLAATGNRNKIRELDVIAGEFGIRMLAPDEYARAHGLSDPPRPVEDEPTFYGNALLKARAFAAWGQMPALADDSGLEVDALGGRPGVHSARYGGAGASDADRCRKLLGELAALSKEKTIIRSARFRCSLVLASPTGECISEESSLEGEILQEFRGDGGFGYDPIVLINDLGKTLAEVDFEVTCRCGFRALAARRLFGMVVGPDGG